MISTQGLHESDYTGAHINTKAHPPISTHDRLLDPQPLKGQMAPSRIGNAQLARQLKLSPQWTSRIVNGWVNAPEAFMEAASQALDLPVDELFRPGGRNGF